MPSSNKPSSTSNGSVSSNTSRRIPKSRKSMIPRCAGSSGGAADSNNLNRENNGRASGIAAPSPTRHGGGSGHQGGHGQQQQQQRRPPASRKSLGGAILQNGHTSSTPSKNRRVSLAPTASSAHNSGHAPGSYSSNNIDPRDVKDKSHLQNAIRKMVSYLKSRGYRDAASLSVKQLVNGPSGRDFQNIMTFLFRRFDPTFHQSPVQGKQQQRSDEVVLKFEDEVSMAFRCLGYPFPISKTGLVAVGSPHTWPALIAAIDWLVDVLTIRDEEEGLDWGPDECDLNEEELLTLDGSSDRVEMQCHKFLRKSMVAFLKDDNEECEELEGGLLDEFQKDSEKVEAHLTGLDDECGRMREEIAVLNEEVNGLSEAQQKQEEYATNIEKFLNLIQTLNDHKAELTNKVETLTIEKSTTEQQMEDCSNTIEQLRHTINSQELSQEDVRRMEREKSRMEEQIAKQSSILEGQVAVLKEAQEKWCAIYQLLEQGVEEYNTHARQLELIPKNAKHAKGHNFEVKLDKNMAVDSVVKMMGGVDIGGVVKPHVKKLVTGYESETVNEKRQMVKVKKQIEIADNLSEQLVEDIETIKHKLASCEEECEATKQKLETDIKGKQRQLDLLKTRISSLNDPKGVESTLAKYNAEYKQLQLQQQKEEKEYTAKKKAVADAIHKALMLAKEYEVAKETKLKEMNVYIAKRKEESKKIKLLDS
eukprot:CAMPEP_0172324148 /NCGR_PEP_ID=MMETSP1058-20130122/50580_1 /TAXON_ID=83371 /ORGANISM="Detonula confervacea, Strain CCMP 353" /LENGTH=703 /DNA_ID=CAMNT_0013040345 /DNA_START=80 /DNA_END=2191 /DNA_ORIENTATION=-